MASVTYEQAGRVVTLTLNRPDTRNALSRDVVDDLVAGLERANDDKSVSCVLLRAAGASFSSGGNLHELRSLRMEQQLGEAELAQWYRSGIQRIPAAFHAIDVATIAAVHGHAVGAGCDLAAMCDIRIGSVDAMFSESFVRVGLISGDGGAWFLPRVVGPARAREMMLTGQVVDAEKALQWGLLSAVVEQDQLDARALELARQIVALPPNALRATKALLRAVEHAGCEEVLAVSTKFQTALQCQSDHIEAIDALLEKREPHFRGS